MYTDADEILQEEINQYKVKERQTTQITCSVLFTRKKMDYSYFRLFVLVLTLYCD